MSVIGLLVEIGPRPAWQEQALCAQTDPALFFPEKGDSNWAAKMICRRCPVQAECLQHAVDNGEMHGIFGGLTPKERKAMRRAEREAA